MNLQANVRFMTEFRDACSVLCFSETWLRDTVSDDSMSIDGFGLPIRAYRDKIGTGKSQGGMVCLNVNDRWCDRSSDSVTVRKRRCTTDVELLSVSLRPRYLAREFGQLFLTVVYVPPSANAVVLSNTR